MKFATVFLLGLCPVLLLAQAPVPTLPRHHSLSLEAQSVANGGETSSSGNANGYTGQIATTDGGRVDGQILNLKDKHEVGNRTNLRINIRNLATSPDAVKLEWYFIAAPVGDSARQFGAKDFVFDQGTQDVSIQPGTTETRLVSSKETENVTVRSSSVISSRDESVDLTFGNGLHAVGHSKQTGMTMRGWLVRVVVNGQIIAARGSSDHYEEIANDNAKLTAFISMSAAVQAVMNQQMGRRGQPQ